ncbi:uncharacterized protein LOC123905417 [Trifolium pratense]|nr:uncharacterized protein LOC123905417 [Trifolium pratense]
MASKWPPIIHGSPLAMFEAVHLPNETFGELDPFFIRKYFKQLGTQWKLYDGDGIPHQVEFNMSTTKPLITFGWPRIRNYYKWNGNQSLTFHYYGQDTFLMIVCEFEQNESPSSFPQYHSLSTNLDDYRSFLLEIKESHLNSSKLVLPHDFGNHLSLSDYSEFILCGAHHENVTCKFIKHGENGVEFTFEKGWKKWCKSITLLKEIY